MDRVCTVSKQVSRVSWFKIGGSGWNIKRKYGGFPGGPVVKTPHSQARVPGWIPGQGTRSHTPQLKIPCATTKTQYSQIIYINKYINVRKYEPLNLRGILTTSEQWRFALCINSLLSLICLMSMWMKEVQISLVEQMERRKRAHGNSFQMRLHKPLNNIITKGCLFEIQFPMPHPRPTDSGSAGVHLKEQWSLIIKCSRRRGQDLSSSLDCHCWEHSSQGAAAPQVTEVKISVELRHHPKVGMQYRCFQTVVLEKTLESPLDCKMIQPVNPKGNQPWIFIGRTKAEVEAPIFWLPDAKSQLTGKDPNAGKDWRQDEKGMMEDEMVCHYRLNGYEFGQTLGDGEGQESLMWYSPWSRKESDTAETEQQYGWAGSNHTTTKTQDLSTGHQRI